MSARDGNTLRGLCSLNFPRPQKDQRLLLTRFREQRASIRQTLITVGFRTHFSRPTVAALSPGRYKIEFTADAETHQALRQLQELMRHQVPNGDLGEIMKEALFLLLAKVKREKLAQVTQPRKRKAGVSDLWMETEPAVDHGKEAIVVASRTKDAEPGGNAGGDTQGRVSRHIPAAVKRSVWKRDQGQCAFVGRNGQRCTERGRLEFHHVHAYALGGPATIDNIALRCRAHNAHESRLLFGPTNGKKVSRSGASSASADGINPCSPRGEFDRDDAERRAHWTSIHK